MSLLDAAGWAYEGKALPKKSAIEEMMKMDINLWVWPENNLDLDVWHDGLRFDYNKQIAAFVWLDGIEPLKDIDLTKLAYKHSGPLGSWETPDEHIWMNEIDDDKKGESQFTLGPDGTWAICNEEGNFLSDNFLTRLWCLARGIE